MKGQFGARDTKEYRRNARDVYKRHYAEIRALLKDQPDRLLEYKLGSGWKPLCDFLGVPIPQDEEFPRINESHMHDEMAGVVATMLARSLAVGLLKYLLPLVVAFVAWQAYSKR